MPDSPNALKVFLCHASEDKDAARNLYHRLRKHGFDPWLDEEKLLPGQNWRVEIRKAVRSADAVIVCLSPNSTTKEGYVQKEIRFALDAADEKPEGMIYLIPARLEDCAVPERLSDWQWVDLHREGGFERLLRSLRRRAKNLHRASPASAISAASSAPSSSVTPSANPFLSAAPVRTLLTIDFRRIPVYQIGGLELVKVSAGKFIMGSSDTDEDARDWEKPQHIVEIPYDYWIGRFPVTNAQYNEFVQAQGIEHPVKNWQRKFEDHPVTRVTWYDALAYCRWLTPRIWEQAGEDFIIRLPSEAEWEKAARGTSGNRYPWGDTWDPKKCNSEESGIGDTTPVGQFSPEGDSPYGCADMAGNVWEWTGSLYKPYPYDPADGSEDLGTPDDVRRVLRGGAFHYDQNPVRTAARDWLDPDGRDWDVGFRVVLSPTAG